MNDRYFPISGTINLRDFGGYPTHEGRSVQRGRLFRSGHMAEMNDHGLTEFAGLDIETICDLRRPEERAQPARRHGSDQQVRRDIVANPARVVERVALLLVRRRWIGASFEKHAHGGAALVRYELDRLFAPDLLG